MDSILSEAHVVIAINPALVGRAELTFHPTLERVLNFIHAIIDIPLVNLIPYI